MQRITTLWNRGWVGKLAIGLGAFVLVCCIFGAFARRTPATPPTAAAPTAAAVQAVAATQSTVAPEATAAPKPTEAPKPTATQAPTATPEPTAAPTAVPSPTPLPEPITLSGKGKVVTDKFTPPSKLNRVVFEHRGQRNFIVHSYKDDGSEDFLVNTIGNYNGEALLTGDTPLYFEVDADGAWSATVEPIAIAESGADAITGHGDVVTGVFQPASTGAVPYSFSHTGTRNFIVHLYCAGGEDFVVNEIGKAEGQVVVRFPDGPCLWQVQADGDWSVKPK